MEIAISRFNFIYDRTRNVDKIIDIIVGFESLFVEGKERPNDRGAFVGTACSMLIGESYEDRKIVKKILKNGFNIRNKIVPDGRKEDRIYADIKVGDELIVRKSKKNSKFLKILK